MKLVTFMRITKLLLLFAIRIPIKIIKPF